ncbi:MAG: ATP-dependent DNA helicase [Nitrospirota bacterium]
MITGTGDLTGAFDILKNELPGYENRPQQIRMAEEVLASFKSRDRLLVEAGTGVGKSFAYLVPAILSHEKTVISTASIALQDQLVNKDLEFLKKVLAEKITFDILKGKNNYLCLKREREFQPDLDESYESFVEWVSDTETGDRDELHFIPDFWSRVCGDSDDCSAGRCPFYNECFYYSHYKALFEKDIIVVNHHILVYDMLSDYHLLPFHSQLIVDEAQQLENVISHAAGSILNYSRVMWLLYRLKGFKIAVDHLFDSVESFFRRVDIPLRSVSPVPDAIVEELSDLGEKLALEKVLQRLSSSKESFTDDEAQDRAETTINYVKALDFVINDFIDQEDEDRVYYVTGSRKFMDLRSSLVESRSLFNQMAGAYESIVMTSATLTSGGGFEFIKERLGIADFREVVVDSPFDFKKQALLYIDTELPSPVRENSGDFYKKSIKAIEGLVNASKGRALVLFTSYNHLRFVSENMEIDYPCKSQGDMPPSKIIKWFKKTPNPVLLATSTFWQGIDIKGEKLSMVIIVKMPFGSPGDPVYDERCRRLGELWFSALALPSAILQLRQGFGRLIRGTDDRGVIAILDTRLVRSSYGRSIVSSMPKMNIVHKKEDVQQFFNEIQEDAPAINYR